MPGRRPLVRVLAPENSSLTEPEVRFAAILDPHGRMQSRSALAVHRYAPVRSCFWKNLQLDSPTTSAWTAHANTPVLPVLPCENQVPARQGNWQAISINDHQLSRWGQLVQQPLKVRAKYFQKLFHRRRRGKLSRGSRAPRASRELWAMGN
jgi:hypothetical protein